MRLAVTMSSSQLNVSRAVSSDHALRACVRDTRIHDTCVRDRRRANTLTLASVGVVVFAKVAICS